MGILNAYTRRSLRENRTRTLVTVIGIILSMSLFTAVIEGAWSGLTFLIDAAKATDGAFTVAYTNLTDGDVETIRRDPEVSRLACEKTVFTKYDDADYEYSIHTYEGDLGELGAVRLTSGRYPENSREAIVQKGWPRGKTEEIGKTYEIVGEYRGDSDIVYTTGAEAGDGYGATVYVELKDLRRVDGFMAKYDWPGYSNRALLRLYGLGGDVSIRELIFGFAAILVILVSFGSVSLIYNSFSISVSDRTRQLGILKSVGATKKQIRGTVLYEALVLSAVGVPVGMLVGCVGIGVTLWCLRDAFSAFVGSVPEVQMRLVLNPAALAIAAAAAVVTTLISAWIPALRAMRISPIEAIRQTSDVKISPKEVRISPLTRRLFGFEGVMAAKSFKRNRKRYRSTVVSLFMSVVLFISASSFCAYLTEAVDMNASDDSGDDIRYYTVGDSRPDPDYILRELSEAGDAVEAVYFESVWDELRFSAEDADPSQPREGGDFVLFVGQVAFIDDAGFRRLCEANGVDPAKYFESPIALMMNDYVAVYNDEDGGSRLTNERFIKPENLPVTAELVIVDAPEGWYEAGWDGETDEYIFVKINGSGEEKRVPADECVRRTPLTVGGTVTTAPLGFAGRSLKLFYPYSMRGRVMGGEELFETDFAFKVENHAEAMERMTERLAAMDLDTSRLRDYAESKNSLRMLVTVVNVFAYGFIVLISLIAAANVFNTVSTGIALRRRELAMLRSVGLGDRGFMRMMNYECLIYGVKALLWGLPASVAMTFAIYCVTNMQADLPFFIPPAAVIVAVLSVFAVVFASMLYAAAKVRKENVVEALKNENA